jgi:hypothetical protein
MKDFVYQVGTTSCKSLKGYFALMFFPCRYEAPYRKGSCESQKSEGFSGIQNTPPNIRFAALISLECVSLLVSIIPFMPKVHFVAFKKAYPCDHADAGVGV